MLRIAIFASLFAAIFSGAWATFLDPTPENAANILNPTPEKIAEANGYIAPVLEWIKSQTPESIGQLFRDAAADVKASLDDPNAPVVPPADAAVTGASGGTRTTRLAPNTAGAPPASTSTQPATQEQPGIDWYTGKN